MTKKLEEVFDLPPIDETEEQEQEQKKPTNVVLSEAKETQKVLLKELTNSEKINKALKFVDDIDSHDNEMDEISELALKTFYELHDLGMQIESPYVGKVFEVASTMLKTALEARDAKASRKLKQIELLIKKQKIDIDNGEASSSSNGAEFDRNELLDMFRQANSEVNKTDEDDNNSDK